MATTDHYPQNFTEGCCEQCSSRPIRLQGFCHAVCETCGGHDFVSGDYRGAAYVCSDCRREQRRETRPQYGVETRGYMTTTTADGGIKVEAGWYRLDWSGNIIARKIGGRNSWHYGRQCEFDMGWLTFTPDRTAK